MITSIRIPDDMEQKLDQLVELTGKKKSTFIIEALRDYIDDLDDYYLSANRMRDYDETESVSLAEMMKQYDMEN